MKAITTTFEELSDKYNTAHFLKVSTLQVPEMFKDYGVNKIPCFMVLHCGLIRDKLFTESPVWLEWFILGKWIKGSALTGPSS